MLTPRGLEADHGARVGHGIGRGLGLERTERKMKFFSPAKINLFLRILRKRSDGYHEIASLMQTIDLGDIMEFQLSSIDSLSCSDPTLPCDHHNLVSKAVDLFRRKTGLNFAIQIHLEKKIPMQAGLGGGSSNAATTLWALNTLLGWPATLQQLQEWSSEIGSDVPFFFSQGSAYCTGRGEKVFNLPPLQIEEPLSLFKPPEGLSTPLVYRTLHVEKCPAIDPQMILEDFCKGEPFLHNDLEMPALEVLPRLAHYKQQLTANGLRQVTLSGSGTSFFGFGKAHIPIKCLNRAPDAWY
jgi:4-diphosphocytidyl-2-C-methyl-D-erythritol kinase